MESLTERSSIPESFFEHRQLFAEPWVDRWVLPNPFVSALFPPLRLIGVELTDFSFNKDASTLGEIFLNIAIRKLNAAVRIGLDTVTFIAASPYWSGEQPLLQIFEEVSQSINRLLGVSPKSQDATLAFHLTTGTSGFGNITRSLVNKEVVGDYIFYGVALYRVDGSLLIDKSAKYEGAVFVRLQRSFSGTAPLVQVAKQLYEDELTALNLLGIQEVP